MDVKLSSTSSSSSPSLSPGKHFDFCDDLSEHGYGSLEDLDCPTINGSPMVQGCDVSPSSSSSSLPTTITTTTITSSLPSSSSSSPPLSSSSSIDSIASLNNSSSPKSMESTQLENVSTSLGKDSNPPHRNVKSSGDQESDTNNNPINVNSSTTLGNSMDNSYKESNHHCKETSSGESRNDQKTNDGKVHSPSPQMLQSGNRFRFVPKNRQANNNNNDAKCKGTGTSLPNGRNNNTRGPRKGSRSESDYDNRKRSQIRNKSNEDVVFIIRRADRSLRRTVSESSGETQPVRGILKYPRGWNRRTLSESNCDNTDQSNLMDSHENGQTQSLECISPLEGSGEASTESVSCSSAGESPGHDEDKPKKSVHFNCYVSKATFKINSTILNNNNNNKHSGSNKKKNRRQNSNNPSLNHANSNDHKNINNTSTSTTVTQNTKLTDPVKQNINHKNYKDHPNKHTSRWKSSQSQQQLNQHHQLEPNNNRTKIDPTKPLTDQQQSVNCDAKDEPNVSSESVIIPNGGDDKTDQSENIDPMETKMRSRQDSGYDSETSDRKGFVEDSGTTTCVKSPNRQFTVKKVDLN